MDNQHFFLRSFARIAALTGFGAVAAVGAVLGWATLAV